MQDMFSGFVPRIVTLIEGFDPTVTERGGASFLFRDGIFEPVAYQRHLNAVATISGMPAPDLKSNDFEQHRKAIDALKAYAVANGLVMGWTQPAEPRLKGFLDVRGARPAMAQALSAFEKQFPDVFAGIDEIRCEEVGTDGMRVADVEFSGKHMEPKLKRWLRGR